MFLNIISDQINWNVDKILLRNVQRCKNVAVYSVGSQFNGYFLTFSYALSSLMTPKAHTLIANHADNRETSKFFRVIRQSAVCRYGLYLSYDNRSRQTFYQTLVGGLTAISPTIPHYCLFRRWL